MWSERYKHYSPTELNISFFRFPVLSRFSKVSHAIFTRNGGYSKGAYKGLNICDGVGDDKQAVEKNRALILNAVNGVRLVFAKQVHGTKVAVLSKGADIMDSPPEADALVTDIPDIHLVIQVADCQAVFLYDPVRHVIANIHSGWRGSIQNIIGHTIHVMKERFFCNPRNMVAAISPSLGPCCAEFINYSLEIHRQYWKYKDSTDHFDFWSISKDQLTNAGVLIENIDICGYCTRCRTDLFFSYRAEKTTGRFAAVIGIINP